MRTTAPQKAGLAFRRWQAPATQFRTTHSPSSPLWFIRIVWRMDPKQEQQRQNRGAALWGNLVITAANSPGRVIAANKETGKSFIHMVNHFSNDLGIPEISPYRYF
jgi:hypothetical protein